MARVTATALMRSAGRAALPLSPDEARDAALQLENFLDVFADPGAALEATGTPRHTTRSPLEREDVAVPWTDPDGLLAAAPMRRGRFIAVPRVLPAPDGP